MKNASVWDAQNHVSVVIGSTGIQMISFAKNGSAMPYSNAEVVMSNPCESPVGDMIHILNKCRHSLSAAIAFKSRMTGEKVSISSSEW